MKSDIHTVSSEPHYLPVWNWSVQFNYMMISAHYMFQCINKKIDIWKTATKMPMWNKHKLDIFSSKLKWLFNMVGKYWHDDCNLYYLDLLDHLSTDMLPHWKKPTYTYTTWKMCTIKWQLCVTDYSPLESPKTKQVSSQMVPKNNC